MRCEAQPRSLRARVGHLRRADGCYPASPVPARAGRASSASLVVGGHGPGPCARGSGAGHRRPRGRPGHRIPDREGASPAHAARDRAPNRVCENRGMNYRFGFAGGMVAIFATAGCGDSPNPATPTAPASALVSVPGTATGEPTGFVAQSVAGEWNKPPSKPFGVGASLTKAGVGCGRPRYPGEWAVCREDILQFSWHKEDKKEGVNQYEIRMWLWNEPTDWIKIRLDKGIGNCILSDSHGCFDHVNVDEVRYGTNSFQFIYGVNSFQFLDLPEELDYVNFRVRAYNDFGASPWSVVRTARRNPPPPEQPTITKVTGGDGWVRLEWIRPNASIDGSYSWQSRYKLATASTWGPWKLIPDSNSITEGFTFSGLTNGIQYSFQIRARDGDSSGECWPRPGQFPLAYCGWGTPSTTVKWRPGGRR